MTHDVNYYINDIPTTWKEILVTVKDITGCEAVLAGGSLRDLICGRVPKDLDIFIFFGEKLYSNFHQQFQEQGWLVRKNGREESESSKAPDSRGYIDDMTYYTQGLLVNLVSYLPEENTTLFENFDINSSMIMFDGEQIISDKSFRKFVDNKEIKIITKMRRTEERISKLETRYTGYKWKGRSIDDDIPF